MSFFFFLSRRSLVLGTGAIIPHGIRSNWDPNSFVQQGSDSGVGTKPAAFLLFDNALSTLIRRVYDSQLTTTLLF